MCEFMAQTILMQEQMLLSDQIRLGDIPVQIRIRSKRLYIAAFRADRNISEIRYTEDLQLLKSDIASGPVDRKRQWDKRYLMLQNQARYCVETGVSA